MVFVFILDAIIAYDRRTNAAVNVVDRFPEHYSGDIIDRKLLVAEMCDEDAQHIELINLIIGGWNNYVRNQDRLTGLLAMKQKQSKLIGFTPIVVSYFENK